MHTASAAREEQPRRTRPSRLTVFTTAFVAGAAVAFGVNRMLDVQLAQTRPQVECEPIFVALHALPQGSPITVWDVALKDWPRAMLPTSALRARDTFEGMVLRHPLREGQPLLAVQLMPASATTTPAAAPAEQSFTAPPPAAPNTQSASVPEADLWTPAEPATPKVAAVPRPQVSKTDVEFVAPIPQEVSPDQVDASREVGTSRRDVLPPDDGVAGPLAQEAAPPSEPTLAEAPATTAAPERATTAATETVAVAAEPQAVPTPGLLPPSEPLYAPVPASPPTALDGALSGVGDLSSTSGSQGSDQSTSVLKHPPSEAAAATTQQQPSAGRYLVVPERIALQADSSFAPPPAAQPAAPSPAESPAQRPQSQTARSTAQSTANSSSKAPQRSATSTPSPKRSQPPGNATGRQTPAATARPRGGMFPNLSAGIEAWTGSGKPVAAQPSPTPR